MSALDFAAQQIFRAKEPQKSNGMQLPEDCLLRPWNQLSVEAGWSRDCVQKREALDAWESALEMAELPDALLAGDGLFPPNLANHPRWACDSGRVVNESRSTTSIPQGPQHPAFEVNDDPWGDVPWGTAAAASSDAAPGAAPSHGPKRARKDNRPEGASPWGSQQASSSSQQPEQEQEPVATWVEVPFPEGTVEHTFVFGKENMTLCRGKIIHAESDPNHLPPAYDKTPKFAHNMEGGTAPIEHYVRRVVTYLARLQSVTQNTDYGLALKVYVNMGIRGWLQMYSRLYNGCDLEPGSGKF